MRASVIILACLLSACGSREPSETELLNALQRHHRDWSAAQRRPVTNEYSPLVNLPFEAALTLHIVAVHKEKCRPATEEHGFICVMTVEASTAYAPNLRRRMEGRFVEGTHGWLAVSPHSLDSGTPAAAVN